MRVIIYDLEVFQEDWVAVFQEIAEPMPEEVVFHNDNYGVKEFVNQPDIILGGFNNKHYDSWILQTIITGGQPFKVKEHNDWIIEQGKNGWEFPYIQYQRLYFKSFDLRDDLPINVSLKSIEGMMGQNIVESSIPFNIKRKLTSKELAEVIAYCKTDVRNTVKLYETRKKYLDSKMQVARLKGIDESEALGLTNAKLTAKFLDAKWQEHTDEMEYTPPPELRIGKYKTALDFFLNPVQYTIRQFENELAAEKRKIRIKNLTRKIEELKDHGDRYATKLEMDIAGVPHILAWGGIHGAIKNYFQREDPDHKIVTIDVGSYYPSMMLQYNYISRNIPSAAGYAEVYHTRLDAKHKGDKATADALKLILNTCYGAMKNRYNDLYDPRNASAICITGMLLLTDLIDKLEAVKGFELIQSNTDGIIIRYPLTVEADIEATVSEWEQRTRLNMEYTVIHAIAQKDVNNYVMKAGETYLIKDGIKTITEQDKGKLKTKGGYVSLAKGGNFINNSMVVLHKALVALFMDGVPIETTIRDDNELKDYQIIAKTGSSYDGTYWMHNGKKIQVQRVNRVYATTDTRCGTIYKIKNGKEEIADVTQRNDEGRSDKIASLPDHCIIDNDNRLTIRDIDKSFYIELAKKRAADYLGDKYKMEDIIKMAETTAKKTTPAPKQTQPDVWASLNIYEKLAYARSQFLKANIKKSGVNRFAEYKYFELADIVPAATEIFGKIGLLFVTSFSHELASGVLINTDKPEERLEFTSPMRQLTTVSQTGKNKMNEVQGLGAEETYQRRYLYMMALDIVEADTFDAIQGKEDAPAETSKPASAPKAKQVSPEKRQEIAKEVIDADGAASDLQIKSIKTALKRLRDKGGDHEDYVKACIMKTKSGLSKKDAEDLLLEIGQKVNGE